MRTLGLTGSIGMGKTTTAAMFRDRGIPVWDADATVHALYSPGGHGVRAIEQVFPRSVRDGAVDRAALKEIISSDPQALGRIEALIHPLVAASRGDFLESARAQKAPLVVCDIPLLFETGSDRDFDAVAVVSVPADVQRERVLSRGTMTPDQFEDVHGRQMPDEEKRKRADYVIDTSTLASAQAAVDHIIADMTESPHA